MSEGNEVAQAAREYIDAGHFPIPLPAGMKGPKTEEWQTYRLTEEDVDNVFDPSSNLGVILGITGLQDADGDCPEVLVIADAVLPNTGWLFGRANAPRSHRIYTCPDAGEDTGIERFVDPVMNRPGQIKGKATLIELRGHGGQTVFPPSVWTDNGKVATPEPIRWDTHTEPATVAYAELYDTVAKVAGIALLARYWPKGQHNDATLALAGWLLRNGEAPEATTAILQQVERANRVTESGNACAADHDVAGKVRATVAKLQAGESTTGFPRLVELYGGDDKKVIFDRVSEWFGYKKEAKKKEETDAAVEDRPVMPRRPGEFLRDLPKNLRRVRTPIETLNRLTRGGIPTHMLTSIIGSPAAGKTTLAITGIAAEVAIEASTDDWLVVVLAQDEGAFLTDLRMGQRAGLDPVKIEALDPETITHLSDFYADKNIFLYDDVPLEKLAAWAEKTALDLKKDLLFIVDSAHSVMAGPEVASEGERITYVMRFLKRFAERGHAVLVTGEANRAAYRNKDADQNTKPITAGADSRKFEFFSRVYLFCEQVWQDERETFCAVALEKNMGPKGTFKMRINRQTLTVTEITDDELEAKKLLVQTVKDTRARKLIRSDIINALRLVTAGKSTTDLRAAVKGHRSAEVDAVRDEMVEDGELLLTDAKGNAVRVEDRKAGSTYVYRLANEVEI